ncbi:MAG TPA: Rne/Rng family ribonuclease [Candidatus Omnitrophica bacterium]|nr:Rne/Rng family ribonuclease [Candidatus Omnitrophota bacterium]
MVHKTILINEDDNEIRTAILRNNLLTELAIERKERKGIAGSIYKGKVKDIIPGMDAAFIDIGWERTGFLYISEVTAPPGVYEEIPQELLTEGERTTQTFRSPIERILKEGEDILVQVVRDPVGSKGPRLTTFITIPGKFLVLMPTINRLGISKKISNLQERKRIRGIFQKIKPRNSGLILRTIGEGKDERLLTQDLNYLLKIWERITRSSKRRPTPSLLYEEPDLAIRTTRDIFNPDEDRLIIDDFKKYRILKRLLMRYYRRPPSSLLLHSGNLPLFEEYNIEEQIGKALRKKVWLASGGYITVEETEALVSIDVNSGRFTGVEGLEDTALKINLEAAKEITRQVILRNLGGIIIIDFIDMRKRENKQKLINTLRNAFKNDRAKTKINTVSSLGLVEMTRERISPSLAQMLCESCPSCQGSGVITSVITAAINKEKEIRRLLKERKEKIVKLRLNPEVSQYLKERKRDRLMERIFRKRVILWDDENLGLEELKIVT